MNKDRQDKLSNIAHVNSFLRVLRIVISVSDAMYHSADSV